MIFGFAVTSPLAGRFLDPFSYPRLVEVTAVVRAATSGMLAEPAALRAAVFNLGGVDGGSSVSPGPPHASRGRLRMPGSRRRQANLNSPATSDVACTPSNVIELLASTLMTASAPD